MNEYAVTIEASYRGLFRTYTYLDTFVISAETARLAEDIARTGFPELLRKRQLGNGDIDDLAVVAVVGITRV